MVIMESLGSIECFVRSAEVGSFAEAARRLGLTPAAVGKSVAKLEARLGVRLFQRSTRRLTLTEAGQLFLAEVGGSLHSIQNAMANLASAKGRPAGTLKVSMGTVFGRLYIVPLLGEFLRRFPDIRPDWHFDNRQVDLIGQGFDAAIGGGFDLPLGVVARKLTVAHRVLVASAAYLEGQAPVREPDDLRRCTGILIRSPQTGRVRSWQLTGRDGEQERFGRGLRGGGPRSRCCPCEHAIRRALAAGRELATGVARLACGRWAYLDLLRRPQAAAWQDPRLCRLHHRAVCRAATGGAL